MSGYQNVIPRQQRQVDLCDVFVLIKMVLVILIFFVIFLKKKFCNTEFVHFQSQTQVTLNL